MSGQRARTGSLLAAILIIVSLTAGAPVVAAGPTSEARSVDEVLDIRERALVDGDREAWMATLDPSAPPEFVEAQTRMFDGLTTVGLSGFDLSLDEDVDDLSPPGLDEVYDAPAQVPATILRYRFTGYDDRDAIDTLWWTYVERDDAVYVAGDTDLERVGLFTQRQLWDLGAVETLTSQRVLILSHPGRAARAAEVAGLLEEAMAVFDSRWDLEWDGAIVVVVPDSADEVETILQTTLDLDNFVAFVSYGIDRDDGYQPTAERMFLQDERLAGRSRSFQVDTLVHELVHAATSSLTGPFVDSWVHEGLAEWIADDRPAGLPVPAGSDGRIPQAFEFRTGAHEDIIRSYEEATSIVSFFAERDGPDTPADFFARLGSRRIEPGTVDHHVEATLSEVFGLSRSELEAEWAG